ncbi:Transcription termination/antitermination protein NusG [Candidatus Entotheonellaceae bacterium PAL068K]
MSKQWYVLHTYSGHENKVKAGLEERLKAAGLREQVGEILVPTEDVVEIKGGKRRVSSRKFFPGYVLVELEMSDTLWYVITNTPKVTGFLGGEKEPTPLSDEDMVQIQEHRRRETAEPRPKVLFDLGENVRVINGPFTNFTGVIKEVHPERGKLKVMVSIFGRATPVELEFLQVEQV